MIRLLIVIFILHAPLAFAESVISVSPYTVVRGSTTVKLEDVAQFYKVPAEIKLKLGRMQLGDAPPIGEKRVYTNLALSEVFRSQQSELKGQGIKIKIPKSVTVENGTEFLTSKSVKSLLKSEWSKACSNCQVEISHLSMPLLPENLKASAWNIKTKGGIPKGSFNIPVEVMVSKEAHRLFWVTGHLIIRKKVPVLSRKMNLGERVQPGDFKFEWRDVTFATDGYPDTREIIGRRLKRSMRNGDIIWKGALERVKAVRRGDVVKVSHGGLNWQITLTGTAQQDGFIGDTIQIKNNSSKKMVMGYVSSSGEVVLQ